MAPRPGLEPETYGLTVADRRIFWDFMGLRGTNKNHYLSMGYAILLFQLISLDSIRAQDFSDTSRTRRPTDACDNGPSHRSPQAESAAFQTDGRSWPGLPHRTATAWAIGKGFRSTAPCRSSWP